jgi:hypothetical protein
MYLHPIEAAWRRFRSGPHADLLRKSLETRSSYLRFIHMARLPNEIVLPGAVAWNLVALGEARASGRADRLANQHRGLAAGQRQPRLGRLPRRQNHLHHRVGTRRLPGALALAGPHAYRGAPVALALPSAGSAVWSSSPTTNEQYRTRKIPSPNPSPRLAGGVRRPSSPTSGGRTKQPRDP